MCYNQLIYAHRCCGAHPGGGTQAFSSSGLIPGYNALWVLEQLDYLHGSSFAAAQEELSAAVRTAEWANKGKSDFLANMSHDIRTPMNAIVGITSLMEHEPGLSGKMQTYIQKVRLSSRHLLSLINDILGMSKIESSEVTLSREHVSLAEQVGQVDSIIRSQTTEHGQSFVVRATGIRAEYLMGDGVRLRQILLNLLSNAVKYTPPGAGWRCFWRSSPTGGTTGCACASPPATTAAGWSRSLSGTFSSPLPGQKAR